MVLIKHLDNGIAIVEAGVIYFFNPEIVVKIMIHTHLSLSRDVKLFHGAGTRYLHVLFNLLINTAYDIPENIFVGEPEVDEEKQSHQKKAAKQSGKVPEQL